MRIPICLLALALSSLALTSDARAQIADHRIGPNGVNSGTDGSCNGSATFTTSTDQFTMSDGPTNGVKKRLIITDDYVADASQTPGRALFYTIEQFYNTRQVRLNAVCTVPNSRKVRWDIGTDNTSWLRSCVANAALCTVPRVANPSRNYLVLGKIALTTGKTLNCEAGASFFFPRHDNSTISGIDLDATPRSFLTISDASNVTVSGCKITGTNINMVFHASQPSNYFIAIFGDAHNNLIARNTLSNGWSLGDVVVDIYPRAYETLPYPSHNVIADNAISNCGLAGIALTLATDTQILRNTLINCNLNLEPGARQVNSTARNLIANNVLENRNRAPDGNHRYLTGIGTLPAMMFNPCGGKGCYDYPASGASTIKVAHNTLRGPILTVPYCVLKDPAQPASPANMVVAQDWDVNASESVSGTPCRFDQAGCAYKAAGACVPLLGSWWRDIDEELQGTSSPTLEAARIVMEALR